MRSRLFAGLVSGLLDRVGARLPQNTSLDAERTATTVSLAASVLTIVAGALALVVVKRISDRQGQRAQALAALPARQRAVRIAPPPPPPPVGAHA